jgi:hypothetical protein
MIKISLKIGETKPSLALRIISGQDRVVSQVKPRKSNKLGSKDSRTKDTIVSPQHFPHMLHKYSFLGAYFPIKQISCIRSVLEKEPKEELVFIFLFGFPKHLKRGEAGRVPCEQE